MNTCLICLCESKYVKRLCCGHAHLRCQKKWGSQCLICRKNTGIFTKKNYMYIPEVPQLSLAEINEQIEIYHEIQIRNAERILRNNEMYNQAIRQEQLEHPNTFQHLDEN